ncbi:hypothetical protein [Teredinibacter purpureus]|nr:hypothetical protein [Teredinibacter purpureus]
MNNKTPEAFLRETAKSIQENHDWAQKRSKADTDMEGDPKLI